MARARAAQEHPLNIRLPAELRRKLEGYARSRHLPLSSAIRAMLSERLDEIEREEQLTRAERWQRDQAWATAQTILDGTAREVSWEEIRAAHAEAVERLRARRKAR